MLSTKYLCSNGHATKCPNYPYCVFLPKIRDGTFSLGFFFLFFFFWSASFFILILSRVSMWDFFRAVRRFWLVGLCATWNGLCEIHLRFIPIKAAQENVSFIYIYTDNLTNKDFGVGFQSCYGLYGEILHLQIWRLVRGIWKFWVICNFLKKPDSKAKHVEGAVQSLLSVLNLLL